MANALSRRLDYKPIPRIRKLMLKNNRLYLEIAATEDNKGIIIKAYDTLLVGY